MRIITIGTSLLFGAIIAAGIIYPLPFSMLTVQISDLAALKDSPIGTAIYAICFTVVGLFLTPQAAYFYKRMWRPDVKVASAVSAGLLFAAGIGLAMVGIFPGDVNHNCHVIGAVVAFGGIFLSCALSVLPVVKKLLRKAEWPRLGHIVVPYIFMLIVAILTILLVGIPVVEALVAGNYTPLVFLKWFPLCEWLMLFSTATWIAWMIYVSPP